MGPAFSGFFHHTWCNTKEYPTLINGRKIVGINESTERGGGFYVAYKDDGNGDIKSIHHEESDINECEKGNEVKTYWYGTCYSRPGTEKDIKLEKIPVTHGGHKCSEHSKCVNNFGSYTCECNQGWTGKLCDKDLNECGINPCKNNGTCHNTPGSYSCTCTENFAGHDCGEVQLVKRFMRYDILFGGLGAFVFCLIGWFLLMARRKDAGGSTAKSVRESKRRKKVSLHTNQEAPSKKLKKSQSNHDYVVPNINL
uniref:EGF-like domain-containing protein n=1 Tax=Trichuris muris TaxID=70415 RepID=A0A5S6QT27_TRIMR